MTVVGVIGFLALVVSFLYQVPQAVRVWRVSDVSGVSGVSSALVCAGGALWVVYGVMKGQFPTALAGGSSFVFAGLITFGVLKGVLAGSLSGVSGVLRVLFPGVVLLLFGLVVVGVGGGRWLGYLLMVVVVVQYVPQLWSTVRSNSIVGLSVWFVVLSFFYGALWLAYGVLLLDAALIVWGVCATLIFFANLVVVFVRKTRML